MTRLARMESLREIVDFAVQAARDAGADASAQHDVALAVSEVFTNIVKHGYPRDEAGSVTIEVAVAEGAIVVQVGDDAPPFHPPRLPPTEVDSDWESREPGNLGWHLVHNVMDEVRYEPRGVRGNLLTLVKRFGSKDSSALQPRLEHGARNGNCSGKEG